jgi:hypothetical protein
MNRHFLSACAVLAASSALAGPYDQPYALVVVADRSATREEFPPAITKIDGKSTRNTRRSDPIAPGKHTVTVRFETARVAQNAGETTRDIQMDLEGCTRYRIAARRVDTVNWEPKIYSEPIGECTKKFQKKDK